jgi:uncharacterized protein (TIGR00251 family)
VAEVRAWKAQPGGVSLDLYVKPRARASAVLGIREGLLEVAVAAPPVDGAANEELVRTLAAFFEVGRRAVRLISGEGARRKRVWLEGADPSDVAARLERIG